MIVELPMYKFEFYKKEMPTKHYSRGIVVKEHSDTFVVECLSDGKLYEVRKDKVKIIEE